MSVTHKHAFFFNDDGFEVCVKCGLCSSLREMKGYDKINEFFSPEQILSEILLNNHIGLDYVKKIEKYFLDLKSVLRRGYSNNLLFAYCTYITLLQNSVYYSLDQISFMFKIKNFKKLFCQIQKNENVQTINFNMENKVYLRSALEIFLANYSFSRYLDKCLKLTDIVKNILPNSKFSFVIAISLYVVLSNEGLMPKNLLTELCSYFSINKRTLTKKIRVFENKRNS